MGCGFAGISAGESTSDDAYKVVGTSYFHLNSVVPGSDRLRRLAALNGVFAFMALLGCLLRPHAYGSSFLLIAGLQDVAWFYAITRAGGYPILDTIGLNTSKVKAEADKLAGKAARRDAAEGTQGAVEGTDRGVESEGQRVVGGAFRPAQSVN